MKPCLDLHGMVSDNELHQRIKITPFGEVLSDPSFETLAILFQKYLDSLSTNGGDLAAYWMTYIDVVQIMLNLLRASREGDWSLHLSAIHDLIPWCFYYDRQNYA